MRPFLVVGEALIDLVPHGAGTTFSSPWEAQTAGGPLNSAVALARLGRTVSFAGPLSTDAFGRQIEQHLASNGVTIDRAPRGEAPTALALLSLDAEGKASYHFHTAATASFAPLAGSFPAPAPTEWVHLASMVLLVPPIAGHLLDWAATVTGPASLDLNVRPAVEADPARYWSQLQPWLDWLAGRRGVLKASDEDFAFLARGSGDADGAALASRLAATGDYACVVTTLGPDGARAEAAGADPVEVPGRPCAVVDTVGAGDTFMAGFLDRWTARDGADDGDPDAVRTEAMRAALARGVAAASVVVGRRGAQPPTSAEVDSVLAGGRSNL